MIKSVLAATVLAALSTAAVAQTAPSAPVAGSDASVPAPAGPLTINSTIKDLLANPATAAVLTTHLPGIAVHPSLPRFQDMTLGQLAPYSQGVVTPEIIAAIDTDLKALPQP